MGIPVILGIVSSLGQIWWQKGARYLAGGMALLTVRMPVSNTNELESLAQESSSAWK